MCNENADKPLSMVLPLDADIIKSQNEPQHVSDTACQ